MTPPWGTPHRVACRLPSTTTPTRSHCSINCSTRRSLIRRRTSPIRIAWSTLSKKLWMSTSRTHQRQTNASLSASTACPALRLGRYPDEHGRTGASKSGSMTSLHACGPTPSPTVGIPRGRVRPSGVGISTRRTGLGRYRLAFSSSPRFWRNSSTPRVRSRRFPRHRRRLSLRLLGLLPRPATG